MTQLSNLPEIDALADGDYFYVLDVSDVVTPDKKVSWIKVRPEGARITNYKRFSDTITIPNLAAGVEGDGTISVPGAAIGDNVVFNLTAALPANIAILGCWVSAADTVKVRFRNTHASTAFTTADVSCVALVIRSSA
ncbi:hypothetical protein E0J16_25810 [Rhizobium pisi]|uniref:hypothetical protein n=1 Tax=Rhizobium pisi TaxID=574561 RepID=UPI00103EFCFC|nr:hypothetical protein [Rhizobium pisi]TCA48548.1 hypothetical protein E0J16_25810 [Rhizobium pisi]